MDELLTPISTTYLKAKKDEEPLFVQVKSSNKTETSRPPAPAQISSIDEALDVLKSQPDYPALIAVLRFLTRTEQRTGHFQLQNPGPKSAAAVHLLVTEIAPNYWTLLLEGSVDHGSEHETELSHDAALLLQCLRSVTGLNALVAQIRALIQEFKQSGSARRPDLPLVLSMFLDMLASLLDGGSSIRLLWEASTAALSNTSLKNTQSLNLISVLSGGQLLSVVAEAATYIPRDQLRTKTQWITDGLAYTRWIGQNVASWARSSTADQELQFCYELLRRGMTLGYSETLVKVLIDDLLLSKESNVANFRDVCFRQSQISKKIMYILLAHLSQKYLDRLALENSGPDATVSAATSVIQSVVDSDELRISHLVEWCTSASGAGIGNGIGIRRAVLAALAKNPATVSTVLEKSLAQFGDELYIKHAAALQQEAHTQVLLLSAGYVHRSSPMKMRMLLRSSTYLGTISNRIASTQVRTRFLGMVVGETLSELIDGGEKRLNFQMEELETEEAHFLKGLVRVKDDPGPADLIQSAASPGSVSNVRSATKAKANFEKRPKPKAKPEPKISALKPRAIIEEVDTDGEEEEDDDLVPYAKGSDPEDSDDDATLVQRDKVKPPVYIRDLIAFLRDSENYDKQKLGLQTAPVLIRRKANFGTEVSSHADEIAGLLVGVQDKFEIQGFEDLKLQGMIALVVAQPRMMAPWFARTFFEGDYSLSQRTAVLVALGLSAREVAGFEASQYQSAASFASKRLPEDMERMYLTPGLQQERLPTSHLKALPPTALETIAASITSSFLAPLAVKAADATSGPDALKLESFTARYKSTVKDRPRVRAIPNTTATLLAKHFFAPLAAYFQVALRSPRAVVLNPVLLGTYLQTLGIIIHAAGPSTLSLPQLTSELWNLLLGVRVHAAKDMSSLRGWLVAMAALLQVNEGDMRTLCETQGREIVETREWVGGVFERTRGEDGGEENDVKMLAAGVLLRIGEAIEKYQALLMGDMIGFS
ncbi:DNA replication checkpoint protein tel2 [Paramyrothecium foliicola]|nr:DNA replication checkpoint protein tel2 [Paramyrothecium foliicola]